MTNTGQTSDAAGAHEHAAILVVDDDMGKRLAIIAALEPLGHEIVEAESGEDALRAVMRRTFAVVLMDVQMPTMDGYETARFIRLRSASQHTPIIFITAHARDEAEIPTAYESGAVDFIFAPIVPTILRAKVTIFVELFLRTRELERSVAELRDNVTQRKAAEAALEASERQSRQIVEAAYDAFIATDAHGLITDWNQQAEASFGWSRDEVLGRELAATVIPEASREAHRSGIARFLATGEARVLGKRIELTALRRDGREFPVELTISAVETEDGYVFNAFLRDITERRRAQEQLSLARDQALEASRMKSMFVANVSHEIRTPMNGVIGMGELLLDSELDDLQREYAETICSSGESLLTIIDDILDFSKIEAGKLELDPTDFDLREAIERPCAMLAARAHEKGLELAVEITSDVPALVRGDAARVRQVIANLVSNAIKFTAEGEVLIRASAQTDHEGAARVHVGVSDTGIGIKPKALERLFEPYSQADSSTTRRYGGTGLGLAISRQLVELMGGEIGGESEPSKGSCFWFELSLDHAESSDGPPAMERGIAGLRVLVVDDNSTNRRILERQLSSWQVSCEVAESADQALELLDLAAGSDLPYALTLLDQNMPDVDGWELAHAIRAKPALCGMRLLLLSSSGARPEGSDEAAFDGWLTKPVRQSRLYEEIQRVLAGERPVAQRVKAWARADSGASSRGALDEVLVVEDTPVNQVVAMRMLEKWGYRAQIAENGLEALAALSERSFAAVLMDCQMPELDGYETTREIRRRELGGRRTPIIAMTANSMQGERERCLSAGMDDYLSKPLRTRTLLDALTRWASEPPAGASKSDRISLSPGARARGSDLLDEGVIADLEHLDGDVLNELRSLYFRDAAGHVSELSDAVGRSATLAVSQTAHKLKGSSMTLGAVYVSQIASELEATAQRGDLTRADELVYRLQAALDATREALRSRAVLIPRARKQLRLRRRPHDR